MKSRLDNIKFLKIYYVLFFASAAVFFVMMLLTDGRILEDIVHKGALGSDYFMDFFNSVRDASTLGVYEKGVIYPPLANVFYYLVSKMIKPELAATSFDDRLLLQSDIVCLFIYFFYVALTLLLFSKTVSRRLKTDGLIRCSGSLTVLLAFSYPMFYCFQRGNLIMLTAVLTMFFVFNRNSENKYIRELSYIALAVAAGLKLYPAIFGLLLIFDGKIKRALRLAVYGIIFIFVPFVFYGGVSAVEALLNNVTGFSGKNTDNMQPGFICIDAISHYIAEIFDFSFSSVNAVLLAVTYFAAAAVLVLSVKEWQKCWALAFMIMNYASFSRTYTLLFALIPFVLFMLEKEKRKRDIVYLLCFSAFFIVIPAVYHTHIDAIMDFLVQNIFRNEELGNIYARSIVANPNRAAAPFLVSGMMMFMLSDVIACIAKKEHKLFAGVRLNTHLKTGV